VPAGSNLPSGALSATNTGRRIYLIDAKGRIRYYHFGEGEYDKSERFIQSLLKRKAATSLDEGTAQIKTDGPKRRRVQ
jgi:hypothetical protein